MSSEYLSYYEGELCFGQGSERHQLSPFVENEQRPTYLYHSGLIRTRVRQMQAALPGVKMFYAMKANSNPEVLRLLRAEGVGADVVSGGEIHRALECEFPAGDIIYSGVGKTRRELKLALEKNIAQINIESVPELLRLAEMARTAGRVARVSLRLNPDIEIKTHKYIATGLKDNKFGMELSVLPELVTILDKNQDVLELKGISLHLGSQMLEFSGFEEALQRLVPVYEDLQRRFSSVEYFDFGGGLGVIYERQDLAHEEKLLAEYAAVVQRQLGNLRARLQCEPGRWLVAHAGVLLSQVQYIKQTSHKTFVILDTGMHHLLRPALYSSYHQIMPLRQNAKKIKVDVVGPICESADFLAQDREMMHVEADGFVAIADTGAYGYSMQSQYNLQESALEIVI